MGSLVLIDRAADAAQVRALLCKFLDPNVVQDAEMTPGHWGTHPGFFHGRFDEDIPIEGTPYYVRLHEAPWGYSGWSYFVIGLAGHKIILNQEPAQPLVSTEMPQSEVDWAAFNKFVGAHDLPSPKLHTFQYEPIPEWEQDIF
jgi:hypothetical protein